ncbi:enoyl-CoA hydratase/isomerase family protein [Burkholderia contaminans]|nr:enoyl-CoA hydratase/isomerase family protein [Burkholderia contaminans]
MTVKFEMDGPLAIATFADAPLNLLGDSAFAGFEDAIQKAIEHKARAFLTLAEGEHFCAGANVNENFVGKTSNDGRRLMNRMFAMTQRFERLPIPTVAAVRGMCLGGGCELMQLHDIVWAGESARIGQVEARIGTTTLLGGGARLVSRVGLARAKEMIFSAMPFDAATMLEWGLINRVLPDQDLEAKARAYAMKLANGPTVAYGVSKALVNMAASHGLSAADALTIESAPQTFDTEDMRTAVARFAEGGTETLFKGIDFQGA